MRSSLFKIVFLFVIILPISGQEIVAQEPILLSPSHAPVYIQFVRTGKCTKDFSNFNHGNLCSSKGPDVRSFNAAWLRLVNNTRWAIGIRVDKGATEENATPVKVDSTEFIDVDGQKAWIGKMIAKDASEMDVVYNSESEKGCDFNRSISKGERCFPRETKPPEIPLPAMSSDLFIAPGKSIIFPIDLSHIKQYVNLYVLYNFSWEYSGKSYSAFPAYDLQHRVYFGWFELGEAIDKEKEQKKPRA